MTIGAAGENTSFDNYTGNGTTTFFPFSFAIVGPFEVLVIAGGQLKFENTDYYLRQSQHKPASSGCT